MSILGSVLGLILFMAVLLVLSRRPAGQEEEEGTQSWPPLAATTRGGGRRRRRQIKTDGEWTKANSWRSEMDGLYGSLFFDTLHGTVMFDGPTKLGGHAATGPKFEGGRRDETERHRSPGSQWRPACGGAAARWLSTRLRGVSQLFSFTAAALINKETFIIERENNRF
jgi:hypothetical protein